MRALFEADETTRDKLIDEILSAKVYREDDIDRRKKQLEEWNPGKKFEGKCYPLNPVAVYMAVYERLGYDNIGEFKLPVSGVGSSTFFDHYELTDNSGKKIYPTRALQSFEDVVDEIIFPRSKMPMKIQTTRTAFSDWRALIPYGKVPVGGY